MATSIRFGGRVISVPGAYSVIDATALSTVSPSAVGIVALVGTAEGGKPLSVAPEFSDATRAGQVLERFRSGNLRTAGLFAFEPSLDDAIPQGAQRIVFVKVNPATQSTVTLPDALAADSVVLTSDDWGLFTAQVNVSVAAGTTAGKKITIIFEDTTEVFDDVGGTAIFTVDYTPGAEGYDAITGVISATQFVAAATKAETGLIADRAADIPVPGVVRIKSDNAGDTTQTVTIYGLSGANAPISETLALNGVTDVDGVTTFASVTAVRKSAATLGTVTISDTVIPTTLFTLAAGTLTKGLVATTNTPAAGVITLTSSTPAAGNNVVIRGLNAAGAAIAERFDMSASPTVGTTVFASITQKELGDIPGGTTITLAVNAAVTAHSTYSTVQKVVDRLNALDGFTADAVVVNPTTFLMTDMDRATAVSILVTGSFYADLDAFVEAINDGSQFVDAARAAGASLVPANTAAPVYLSGGGEGTTTITEWTQAFQLLRKRRVTQIVPLTNDTAVHALLAAHLVERAGRLRSEANAYIGIGTSDGEGETRSNIKSQIQALSTRHIAAISQEGQRNDPVTGEATWYPPFIVGAVAAGMQAGAPVGEPLTHKRPFLLDVRNDPSWSVEDDAEELIQAGLMMAEKTDTFGVRWVRSITTHLADDNVVFGEVSANYAANTAVFEFRRRLELKIGQRGLAGSVASIKGLANAVAQELVDDQIIVAYRALQVEQVGDVFPVSIEMAPVLPINFIPATIHLVSVRIAA